MIKIIKEGTRKITKCPNCGCEFSYEREDVLRDPVFTKENHVNCPQCNNEIVLKEDKNWR